MLDRIKIENMRLQQKALLEEVHRERKKYGIISVAAGDGMASIMKELGVDAVIEGGQTMNPSTNDFVKEINKIHAENVIVFPNNSNIIMAAKQARDLVEDKNVIVIETKTVPQAIAGLISYNPELEPADLTAELTDAKDQVKTGQITYAVRDTNNNGVEIHTNDIIGLYGSNIVCSEKNIETAVRNLLQELVKPDEDDIITLYYGQDVTDEEAEQIAELCRAQYPDLDVDMHRGDQPVYYYIISVE